MQVWSMNDVEPFKRNYANAQRPSTTPDLRFSVMGPPKRGKGPHRLRIAMTKSLWEFISKGLHDPRLHVHGDAGHGLKLFCKDGDGWKPIIDKNATSLIVRGDRYGLTDQLVAASRVEYIMEHEDHGPVIRIARLPDTFLPDGLINKLPASQVDPETLQARQDKRREKLRLKAAEAFQAPDAQPEPHAPPHADIPGTSEVPAAPAVAAEPARAVALPAPNALVPEPDGYERNIEDLREAIAMVNELTGQIGPAVMLYVDGEGKLRAKRRVIMYTDL